MPPGQPGRPGAQGQPPEPPRNPPPGPPSPSPPQGTPSGGYPQQGPGPQGRQQGYPSQGQQGQQGYPQGQQQGYPQHDPQGSRGYPPQGGQQGGFQQTGSHPYPQHSDYGHYHQYAQNQGMPAPGNGQPGRNRKKVVGTWIAVGSAAVVASVLVALLGFDDPTDKPDAAVSKPPAPVIVGESADPGNTDETPPPDATTDMTNALVIPSTLPPITGRKFTGVSVDPKTWPKACDMLTDAEILSVVAPESSVRERKSMLDEMANMLLGGVNDNVCEVLVDLPNLASYDYPAKITVTSYGYKPPAERSANFAKKKTGQEKTAEGFPTQYDDIPAAAVAADSAYRDDTGVAFIKNGFEVWISVSGTVEDSQGEQLKRNTLVRQYGPSLVAVIGQKF